MFSNLSKGLKITIITIISVILAFCCCSMVLYYFLPGIESHVTYGLTTTKSGNPYIYVEYWSNKENNGVELLDIQFENYATVEDFSKNDSVMYKKGIQFVGDSYGSINFNYSKSESLNFMQIFLAGLFGGTNKIVYSYIPNVKAYYYDSQNSASFKSFENLDDEYRFKVSIHQEDGDNTLYWMRFYGDYKSQESDRQMLYTRDYFEHIDLMYFANRCLDVCRTNSEKADAEGNLTVSVGPMFDFMKYTTYSAASRWESENQTSKVQKILEEYAYINFKIHSDGAKKASDSMFGIIADSNDFEYSNPDIKDTYLYGKQVLDLTEKHFTLKDGKLDFTDRTKNFIDSTDFNLSIVIDLDNLSLQDIEFDGFHDNVKSYKNRVLKIKLKSTDTNGIVTYSEVTL